MPASPAQIEANRKNAARSTGPRTEGGKERSRANALKHGLTGGGVVLPEEDAAEVARLAGAFGRELGAEGEVGRSLARRMAVMSVRMDRCEAVETAALSGRVREALRDFEAPEGADDDEADRLRAEAARLAMFDPSKEASLARQYEAAAERSFFRALKDLRQLKAEAGRSPAGDPASQARASEARLGSFLKGEVAIRPAPPRPAPAAIPAPPKACPPLSKRLPDDWDSRPAGRDDLPFAIGRTR